MQDRQNYYMIYFQKTNQIVCNNHIMQLILLVLMMLVTRIYNN